MKNQIFQTFQTIAIVLIILFGLDYVMAWVGPTATPPNNNTPTPINVGTVNQIKEAGLGVNALSVFGNSFFQGTLGIGDSTPDNGLKVDVEGNIGAVKYCDENGNNCKSIAEISGSGNVFDLAYGQHASSQCSGLSGVVLVDGIVKYCKFQGASCPAGWAQYKNWSTTVFSDNKFTRPWGPFGGEVEVQDNNGTCEKKSSYYYDESCGQGGSCSGCSIQTLSCSYGKHAWGNIAQESCSLTINTCNSSGTNVTCPAKITEIGCY